jgi:hypothetical protein
VFDAGLAHQTKAGHATGLLSHRRQNQQTERTRVHLLGEKFTEGKILTRGNRMKAPCHAPFRERCFAGFRHIDLVYLRSCWTAPAGRAQCLDSIRRTSHDSFDIAG